jgi:hypothetical protein
LRRSSPREPCIAALDEGSQTLLAILGFEELRHVRFQATKRRCLALEARAVCRGQGLLHSERRRLGRDGLGDLIRALDLPAGLDDLLDQPDPMGLRGED